MNKNHKTMKIAFGCFQKAENPAIEQKCWFQTTPPYGEYDGGGSITGKNGKIIEGAKIIFDEESCRRILEDFNAKKAAEDFQGVLVDREHFSCDLDKPSDAMAWAVDMRINPDGSIWTKWDFTPKGRELYESKTLVYRSPVLALEQNGKTFRPFALESIGMTNTPHFKELSPLAAAKAASPINNQQGDQKNMDPEILAALGLSEDAEKEDILNAINALKASQAAAEAKAAECATKKDEAEAKCRALEADAFITANSAVIADTAAFKEVFIKDPEMAKKALGAFKTAAPAPQLPRIVAKSAKTPADGNKMTQQDLEEGLAKCRNAQERCDFIVRNAKNFNN